MLRVIFGSAARAAVLGRLLLRPDDELHLRQLAAQTGLAPRSAQLEIDRLTSIELLIARRSGNRRYVRANRGHPLFEPLREVFERTVGVRARIRKALEEDRRITRAFLYGSYAASPGEAQGSVHLLIIGDASLREVGQLLDPVEEAIRAEIRPVVLTEIEFQTRRESKEQFLSAVLKSTTVPLIGERP